MAGLMLNESARRRTLSSERRASACLRRGVFCFLLFATPVFTGCASQTEPRPNPIPNLTGTWVGVAVQCSDVEPGDCPIALALTQRDTVISGTLGPSVGFQTPDTISIGGYRSGTLTLVFLHPDQYEDILYSGKLMDDSLSGRYFVRERSAGAITYSNRWSAGRR